MYYFQKYEKNCSHFIFYPYFRHIFCAKFLRRSLFTFMLVVFLLQIATSSKYGPIFKDKYFIVFK